MFPPNLARALTKGTVMSRSIFYLHIFLKAISLKVMWLTEKKERRSSEKHNTGALHAQM